MSSCLRVLLPIRIDRFQSPITTLLRAVVEANPEFEFVSFSDPLTDEDRRLAEAFWQLPQIRRGTRWDLLHGLYEIVHHASATRIGLAAGRLNRITSFAQAKYIFTANCQPYPTHPQLQRLLSCARHADVVVPVSRIVADDFEREVGCQCSEVIPNGFDPLQYTPGDGGKIRDRYLGGSHESFILYTSAFLDRKHPGLFLDMMAQMPDLKGVMVGSIPDPALYQSICERAATMPNVTVLGLIPRLDLRDLMQSAAVMLYTSEYEGFPLTVIEAIGCGLPVIARPESSLPELIQHNDNGWLYDVDDLSPWIAKVREILAWSPEQRQQFTSHARQSVVDQYAWSNLGKRYGQLYQQIIKT